MDLLVNFADDLIFDKLYATVFPLSPGISNTTGSYISSLPRDNDFRLCLSLFITVCLGGWMFYFISASLSYFLVYDKRQMEHPKFLKNQIKQEIKCASAAVPGFTLLTVPWFWGEVKGYSKLYENVDEYGWGYYALSVLLFLFFTDMCIYWIHRWEHHPRVYKWLHKPHHKWIVPTPFASHAFHPLDGYFQSVPYHLFAYIFPLQKQLYLILFVAVNIWTVLIHDGAFLVSSEVINSSAHHSVHHLYFNYNYGQYFTFWDRIGGSHRAPTKDQLDEATKNDRKTWLRQAKEVEMYEAAGSQIKPKMR